MPLTPQQIDAELAKLPIADQDKYLEALPAADLEAYANFSNDLRKPTGTAHSEVGGHPVIRDDGDFAHKSDEELLKLATAEGIDPYEMEGPSAGPVAPQPDGGKGFMDSGLGIAARGLVHG